MRLIEEVSDRLLVGAYNSIPDMSKPEVDRRHDEELISHESDTPSSVAAFRHRPASNQSATQPRRKGRRATIIY